jgi:hypothetical protein
VLKYACILGNDSAFLDSELMKYASSPVSSTLRLMGLGSILGGGTGLVTSDNSWPKSFNDFGRGAAIGAIAALGAGLGVMRLTQFNNEGWECYG